MSKVSILPLGEWIFYLGENHNNLDQSKCGKWMYFFNDVSSAAEMCEKAIVNDICVESKHSNAPEGVCCFYLNGDDIQAHKRVINYFVENNLIRRTKIGKLYNISFKYDNQTRAGMYGDEFIGEIKLEQFLNLNTGEWLV